MVVVVLSARPDEEPLGRSPGVLVTVVVLDGLVEAPEEEEVHAEDVVHEDEGTKHGTEAEDERLEGVGVLGGHTKGDLELVVDLVDVLVPGAMVEQAMDPVEVEVLNEEGEDGGNDDLGPGGQMVVRTNANVGRDEMEDEHHGKLEKQMAHQELLDTLHVALEGDHFVLCKVSYERVSGLSRTDRFCASSSVKKRYITSK